MKTKIGKYKFIYRITEATNKLMNGFSISFRADNREEADAIAERDAGLFTGKAKFIKKI